MRSAMVPILRLCRLANGFQLRPARHRAVVVHDFTQHALRASALRDAQRSTEASVCPALTRTPPLRERSGKMLRPGRARVRRGVAVESASARIVAGPVGRRDAGGRTGFAGSTDTGERGPMRLRCWP